MRTPETTTKILRMKKTEKRTRKRKLKRRRRMSVRAANITSANACSGVHSVKSSLFAAFAMTMSKIWVKEMSRKCTRWTDTL